MVSAPIFLSSHLDSDLASLLMMANKIPQWVVFLPSLTASNCTITFTILVQYMGKLFGLYILFDLLF